MSTIDDIAKYKVALDKTDFNIIEQNLERYEEISEYLDRSLLYLDCTRVYPNGMRAMQTIGYPYRHEISVYFVILEHVKDESVKKEYEQKLIDRHDANLAHEAEVGTVWYDKKHKNKWGITEVKEKKQRKPKGPKVSAKAAKAAQKALKLAGLKFNIVKPNATIQEKQ